MANIFDQFDNDPVEVELPEDPGVAVTPIVSDSTQQPKTQVWRRNNGVWQEPPPPDEIDWTAVPEFVDTTTSEPNMFDQFDDDPIEEPANMFDQFDNDPVDQPESPGLLANAWNSFARGVSSEGIYAAGEGLSRLAGNSLEGAVAGNERRSTQELEVERADLLMRSTMPRLGGVAVDTGISARLSDIDRILEARASGKGMEASRTGWRKIAGEISNFVSEYSDQTGRTRTSLREALPVDEKFAQGFAGQVIQGLGQMVGTLPTYVVPGFGPAMALGQMYDEGWQDAVASGETPEKAHASALKYLPASALETLSDKFIISKVLKPLKGQITVGQLAKTVGVTAAAEGATEGAQQAWLNVVASTLSKYDPERPLDQDVINSILVGGVVGGTVSGVGTTATAMASGGFERGRNVTAGPESAGVIPFEELLNDTLPAGEGTAFEAFDPDNYGNEFPVELESAALEEGDLSGKTIDTPEAPSPEEEGGNLSSSDRAPVETGVDKIVDAPPSPVNSEVTTAAQTGPRVVVIDSPRFAESTPQAARRLAAEWAQANLRGNVENDETGWDIEITGNGIKKALSGTRDNPFDHIEAIAAVPEMLRNATLDVTRPDRHGDPNIVAIHEFRAPLNIEGRNYDARMIVKETAGGRMFYDHGLLKKGDPAGISVDDAEAARQTSTAGVGLEPDTKAGTASPEAKLGGSTASSPETTVQAGDGAVNSGVNQATGRPDSSQMLPAQSQPPRLSRAATEPPGRLDGRDNEAQPVRGRQVQGWVNDTLGSWRTQLRVTVHDSASNIQDAELRQSIETEGGVEAFFDPNDQTIHIFADRVASREDAERILRHEGMHWLFNGPLEREYREILERAIGLLGPKWLPAVRRGYPNAKAPVLMEEVMAYEGQTNPSSSAWRQFVYEVKQLARRVFGDRIEFTDADVMAFLAKANRKLERGANGRSGGDIRFSKALGEAANNEQKKRGFVKSVEKLDQIRPTVKELLQNVVYTPITNRETVDNAKTRINEVGPDRAFPELLKKTHYEAKDVAEGIELIGRLNAMGRDEDTAEIAKTMAERGTTIAQALQMFSVLSKLTPEGIQIYGEKLVQESIEPDSEQARMREKLAKLRSELRVVRRRLSEQAILQSKRRGSTESVQQRIYRQLVANKGSLWGRYRDQAVKQLAGKLLPGAPGQPAMLQAFTQRLTRQLREQLPQPELRGAAAERPQLTEAQMIGEAIRNFDKYTDVWTEAQAHMRKLLRDNPEALQSFDAYLGQILKEPFSPASLDRAVKEELTKLKLSMREVLMQSASEKAEVLKQLEDLIIQGAGLSQSEATGLAQSIHSSFAEGLRLEREKLLKRMTRVAREDALPDSKLQRLMKLNNAGALSDQRFFAALSQSYGVPVWTPELSAKVQRLQRDYETATDVELKLTKGAQMFDAVHEVLPLDGGKMVKFYATISMLLNPLTVEINVLGNAFMLATNVAVDSVGIVVDKGVSIFTGKRTRASLDLLERAKGLKTPYLDFHTGRDFALSQGKQGLAAAREGLDHVITLSRLYSRNKWEIGQINAGSGRIFSKGFSRALEDTLGTVLSVPDRAFHGAAFAASIMRQQNAARANGVVDVAPSREMMQQAFLDASEAVFQSDTWLNQGIGMMVTGLNLVSTFGKSKHFGVGTIVQPFIQVPANIALEGFKLSMVGFLRGFYLLARGMIQPKKFDQKQFVDGFSKALVGGVGLTILGYWLFKMGIITAAGEEDDDMNAMLESNGLGRYRFNQSAFLRMMMSGNFWTPQQPQDGDITRPYSWIQPLAMPVAAGAEWAHSEEVRKRTVAAPAPGGAATRFVMDLAGSAASSLGTMESMSLMSGFANFSADIARTGSVTKGAGQAYLGLPSMFLPSILRRITFLMDNAVRETRAGSPLDQMVARFEASVPGLSSNLPARYDVFGEAQQRYEYGGNSLFNVMLNPAMARRVRMNPAIQEMYRVYKATGETSISPRRAPVKLQIEGLTLELSNQQLSDYQKVSGRLTMALYARLAASPNFARLSIDQKIRYFEKALTFAHKETKRIIIGQSPELKAQGREIRRNQLAREQALQQMR